MPSEERPKNDVDAIGWLVAKVPQLASLMDEHIAEHGEMLPYVLFEGDFLRWFIDRVRAGDLDAARAFVDAIEPLMCADTTPPANEEVWNLCAVCFVEGLRDDQDVVRAARQWMGPSTLSAFSHAH